MKEQYLLRGSGFISNRLKSLSGAQYLSRDWSEVPLTDHIVYTAGYGNYYDQKDLYETYKANVLEAIRLLPHTRKSFTYISTSSVLLPVQTDYSRSKKMMESILESVDLPWVVVRPSSVTGVGEQPQHLIPTLIRSCIDGEEMPFVGEPTHDFIDVEDFCNGIISTTKDIDRYKKGAFNLSSGELYTNEQVKEMVEDITGKKANIRRVENLRKYDTNKWVVPPDLRFAEKPLYISISEMVNDYITKKSS